MGRAVFEILDNLSLNLTVLAPFSLFLADIVSATVELETAIVYYYSAVFKFKLNFNFTSGNMVSSLSL